ncbi:hypothetical protein [Streptomyces resistomycificus]|uniref:Uncharacterized protein n=1 Tax=Streptomyces resistomycificus TaxID=67356 RepID=A0A0L8LXE1_9ACTN|nr:hypothetical protein [Streptomyces resistomycificus]KOG42853.1 hypothetical protein ADK37_03900 [Streptomyces resistomycificus]KUO00646.1 hypothetical protein AQJ84_06490 [Streptomyces resistomycificus]
MGSVPLPAVGPRRFRDPALLRDRRVDDLPRRLTLEERIALPHPYAPHGAAGPRTVYRGGLGRKAHHSKITKYPQRRSHHRVAATSAFATSDCPEGVHSAQRATAPAPFSVGPTNPGYPPPTAYAVIHGRGRGRGSNPPTRPACPHRRGLAPEL